MPIKTTCPLCGKTLTAPDTAAGRRGKCPHCGASITLPAAETPIDILEAEPVDAAQTLTPPPLPIAGDIPLAGTSQPGPAEEARRPCPRCGESIAVRALKCRFCGAIFDPKLAQAEAAQKRGASPGDDDLTVGEWVLAILCSGIGCILGIVWMCQGKPKGKKMFFVSLAVALIWTAIRAALESR